MWITLIIPLGRIAAEKEIILRPYSWLMEQVLFALIIAFILFDFLLDRWLDYLNDAQWSEHLPDALKDFYDEEKYKRSQQYDRATGKLGRLSSAISLALILGMLFWDGFAIWDHWIRKTLTDHDILVPIIFFGGLLFASDIIGLPFSIYGIFVIEEKYGFNRMTVATFIGDKLKGYALMILLGGGMLALVVWFYHIAGAMFWLYAWVLVALFSLGFSLFYTSIIVPIFNKLQPLEEGPLREAIEVYANQVNFPLKNIMVMDGSKRSSKANAYFSGMGGRKTIVLFDTLIKDHSIEELVAVLAHEVGHYKKKHMQKGMAVSLIQTGILLFILGWLVNNPVLSHALGADEPSFHMGLLAFSLLYSPVSMLTGILMNLYSRKNEYEADRFAAETYDGHWLIKALKKLSVNQLSNLQPHPWYVFFNYSHPPLLQRIRAIQQ